MKLYYLCEVEENLIRILVASPTLVYEGAEKPIKISLLPNPSHLGKSFGHFSLKHTYWLCLCTI